MSKRKDTASQDGSDDDTDMLDVEFEWFDPQEIDFHGCKTLLKQLFDADHESFNCSALAELIISQPLLGSTVKVADEVSTDAKNNDPFAFLTVLNLHEHRDKPEIQPLTAYIANAASKIPALADTLPGLLAGGQAQVGLLLTERFINMPAEIIPPMYRMLVEEIDWALEAKEPYNFTHYLVLSKTYTEIASKLNQFIDEEEAAAPPDRKRQKGQGKRKVPDAGDGTTGETFYFHVEDEVLHRFALGHGSFDYTRERDAGASDSKRAFQDAGIKPMGHLVLIEAARFKEAVEALSAYVGGSS